MYQLKDKVILVIGGSSKIGICLIDKLLSFGVKVIATYHALDLSIKFPQIETFKLDVQNNNSFSEDFKNSFNKAGGVDGLVYCPGITEPYPFPLINEEDWLRLLDINLNGCYKVVHEVLPYMIRQKKGSIVLLGSLAGIKPMEAPVHYYTSKAGLKGFAECLAKEIGRYQVRINNLAPGILAGGVADHISGDKVNKYLERCSLNRVGSVAEISEIICFLLSDNSSYISGSTIVADGGIF